MNDLLLDILLNHYNINRDIPFKDLSDFDKDIIFEDQNLLLSYLDMQNIEYDDYIGLLNGEISSITSSSSGV